jgi:hypothetical protein
MNTFNAPIKPSKPGRRVDVSTATDDSPYSPYLRRWLNQSATQHRDLLLNIVAASRIGLVPQGPER